MIKKKNVPGLLVDYRAGCKRRYLNKNRTDRHFRNDKKSTMIKIITADKLHSYSLVSMSATHLISFVARN